MINGIKPNIKPKTLLNVKTPFGEAMNNFCDKLTEHDLIEDIKYTLDEEMLDEFITTIKNDSKA